MRPVAYIVVHPTKFSVVESLLYTKPLRPEVDRSIMEELVSDLNHRELLGADFAECMAALWSSINDCSSWRLRSILDRYEGIDEDLRRYREDLDTCIVRQQNLLCMAAPRLVERLLTNAYELIFIETDTSCMSTKEMLVSYPKHLEGVCGEWLKYPEVRRSNLGTVIEGISIPA